MEISNRHNLSEAWVEALKNDPYDDEGSDITATALIDSPQVRTLRKKHEHEITEDVVERVWALLGSGVHAILERAEPSEMTEQRLFATFLGWKVSARYDRYVLRKERLTEYKCTSAWTIYYGDRIADYEAQVNIQAELCERNGFPVKEIEAECLLRDWNRRDAGRVKGYPEVNIAKVPLRLWTKEERQLYINSRVVLHQAARAGNVASVCSDKERWAKRDKKGTCYIRCEDYCPVSSFCPQWNSERGAA